MYCVIMEKEQRHDTKYTPISKNETAVVVAIRESGLCVFGVEEVRSITRWPVNRVHNTLASLARKGLSLRMKRDRYTLAEWVPERLFEIATEMIKPSYISFWSALSQYGLTEQQPAVLQLVSVSQSGDFTIGGHGVQITTWHPGRFYGYLGRDGYVMAEMEKALVDSLYQPGKCGGLHEYITCLDHAHDTLDMELFTGYLVRFGNRSLVSRAGYLMEALGMDAGDLRGHTATGYVLLDPGKGRVGQYDHRWKVIVNDRGILS